VPLIDIDLLRAFILSTDCFFFLFFYVIIILMDKRDINIYIFGFCTASVLLVSYLFFTNDLPFMRAAGVGTGAPDINAKYHDGYATSLTATSSVIYVSDGGGIYLTLQ